MTPHDLFRLEKKLLDCAQGGVVPQIVGLHSVGVEGNTAVVQYDIFPDPDGNGLHFNFDFPPTITREELVRFSEWLATVFDHEMTRH
jgi:hypothetical protein